MESTIDLRSNVIDVRDIIERVEELETNRDTFNAVKESEGDSWAEHEPSDAEELDGLTAILEELKGYGGDEQWRGDWYPVTLIRDTHFEDYAQELAEEVGAIERDATWPARHIDWKAAAEELQQDYSSVEIEGADYWYR